MIREYDLGSLLHEILDGRHSSLNLNIINDYAFDDNGTLKLACTNARLPFNSASSRSQTFFFFIFFFFSMHTTPKLWPKRPSWVVAIAKKYSYSCCCIISNSHSPFSKPWYSLSTWLNEQEKNQSVQMKMIMILMPIMKLSQLIEIYQINSI